jgi:hypothetical protein
VTVWSLGSTWADAKTEVNSRIAEARRFRVRMAVSDNREGREEVMGLVVVAC